MPWSFILVLSCKSYCLGGFVITGFIACHNDENLFKRCFEVFWKAVNTESSYAETRLMQYDSRYYTKQLKIMLIFFPLGFLIVTKSNKLSHLLWKPLKFFLLAISLYCDKVALASFWWMPRNLQAQVSGKSLKIDRLLWTLCILRCNEHIDNELWNCQCDGLFNLFYKHFQYLVVWPDSYR